MDKFFFHNASVRARHRSKLVNRECKEDVQRAYMKLLAKLCDLMPLAFLRAAFYPPGVWGASWHRRAGRQRESQTDVAENSSARIFLGPSSASNLKNIGVDGWKR